MVRWLWGGAGLARVARAPLIPLSGIYWALMRLRAATRPAGVRLPLPTIAIGNLSVGGTGKTPLAGWIAAYCAARGHVPGILLRGYGGDETLVHRRLVPQAVVVADPDRVAGAAMARAQGAQVLVLDDAYQLLAVAPDLNIVVISAESVTGSPWPLPAGPWRERWNALDRANLIVVTRKRASAEQAEALAGALGHTRPAVPVCVACLALDRLEGMQSGTRRDWAALTGRRVVAAAGIADPESFAAQLRAFGADVQLVAYQDHHRFTPADVTRLARVAARGDNVVVTEKDAVKLRGPGRWPGDVPEPLVAVLAVRWERNGRALEQALNDALTRPAARGSLTPDPTRAP
ncbi:MAG TPA: tetraacyldisaccharide 4'-kinase [Gemmatimonadales bacterium]|nr:tetraacyldisaccharide 4'-kinase [Gemmatimonadales bacterium]